MVRTLYSLVLAICLMAFSQVASAQIHADFSSGATSGCSPLVVSFTDQSTGGATSWLWDFGNGNTSVQHNPSAAYLSPGTYTVKLVARNASGVDSIVKTNFVTVFFPPVANLRVSDTLGCTPKTITFTDLSTPGSAAITSWTWDFGDGSTSTSQSPTHIYTNPGTYTIVLLVRDANGCTGRITMNNYITINASPTAAFTGNPTSACGVPHTVVFNNTSSGTSLSYNWDFGDGGGSTQTAPSHIYTAGGSYTVRLTVTTPAGCTAVKTRNSYINIIDYRANFSVDHATGCASMPFHFTDLSSPNANSWSWSFGNGQTSTTKNPIVTYSTPGTYTVTLTSHSSAGCADTHTMTINVTQPPIADFTADSTQSCSTPLVVNFTGLPTGMADYTWDFGDGSSGSGENAQHTYTAAGNYAVRLSITDSGGCTNTKIVNNFIAITAPVDSFTADQRGGCTPLDVNFTSLSTSIYPIVNYEWDFGDGSTGSGPNPTHIYTTTGLYDVSLIITNSHGCTDTLVQHQYIRAGQRPNVNFVGTPTTSCAHNPIAFSDSSDMGDQWLWEFGDGGTSIDQNPSYQYGDTGLFTVTLVVGNNGCFDTLVKPDYIHILAPIAAFAPQYTCADPYNVTFNNTSLGGQLFTWSFGDGDSSDVFGPSHLYAGRGSFPVSLYVVDTISGCFDSTSTNVDLTHPVADFTASGLAGCVPYTTTFTSNSIDGVSYLWDFGDGTFTNGNNPMHTFNAPGVYTIKLFVTDMHGCTDSMVRTSYITVYGATADLTASNTTGCTPLSVSFTDASSAYLGTIVSWQWDLGNGATSTLQNPSSVYTVPGNYSIALSVTDNHGCSSSITKVNLITPTFPVPAFYASPAEVCLGTSVHFNNQSSGVGMTYSWDFGDSLTSTGSQPNHTYADTGYYTVSLHVWDVNGCDSMITKPNYIHVISTHAEFTVDTLHAFCPPLTVNFTDLSHDSVATWQYHFGDGQTSSLENPVHIYTRPGVYHPWLVVANYLGCVDTMYLPDSIVISGPTGTFDFIQPSVCIPFNVSFFAQTSSNVSSYVWDYGDGNVDVDDDSVDHVYDRAGTFNPVLIIRDSVGCTQSIPTPRPIVATSTTADFVASPPSLCGAGNVSFTDLSSAIPGIASWSWNFGDGGTSTQQNPVHYYSTAGAFTVRLVVTNTSGCTDTLIKPGYIIIYPAPVSAFTPNYTVACLHTTIDFTDHSTSDSTIIGRSWSFGDGTSSTQTSPSHTYTTPGTYAVSLTTVTINGCSNTTTQNIVINPLPAAAAGSDRTICVGDTAHMLATGGVTYFWSPSTALSNRNIASPVASPTATTAYSILVTDANGCTATTGVNLSVNPLPVITTSPDTTVCPGQPARINATGGVSYAWSPSANLSNANINNPIATVPASTTFTVTVTDGNGCRKTGTTHVNLYTPPTPIVSPDTAICIGESTVLTVAGGVSYIWSPSTGLTSTTSTSPVASPTISTLYHVQVTDNHGCKANDSVALTINPLPVANAFPDTAICAGANVQIHATGGVSYVWSAGPTLSNSSIADPMATPTVTKIYSVTVTDANGCRNHDSVTVTVNALPTVVTSPDTTVCPGQPARIRASGGVSYAWSPSANLNNANISNPVANVTTNTTFTVTVTNATGCVNTGTTHVNLYTPPTPIVSPDTAICYGESTVLTVAGGVSYIWSPSTGLTSTTSSSPVAAPTTSTLYHVQVTDNHGCKANDSVQLNINPLPVANAYPDTAICIGNSVQMHATGGVSYVWSAGPTLSNSSIANPIATPTATKLYSVTVTDANGCRNADTATVTVNQLPTVVTSPDTTVCPGQPARITASGGVSYAWSPSANLSNANISNPVANVTANTTFTVTVTNATGCVSTGTTHVNLYTPPTPIVSPDTAICYGESTVLTVAGGVSYIWSPSLGLTSTTSTSPVASPPSTTLYHVQVTDNHGCKANDSLTVTINPLPVALAYPDTAICIGGSVQMHATGGVSYAWSAGPTLSNSSIANPIATPTSTKLYSVTVTDANGCRSADTATVTVNQLPTVVTSPDTTVCPGQPARITASGGVSYAWSPSANLNNANISNPVANVTTNTTFTVTVTNATGCVNTGTTHVNLYTPPTPTVSPDTAICYGQTAQISAGGGVSYIWTPAASLDNAAVSNPMASPTATTLYHVQVTDNHGCKANDSLTLTINPLPVANAYPDTAICIGENVQLHATGGITYAWAAGPTLSNSSIANPIATPTVTKLYSVTVTDANGCRNSDSATVTVNALPVPVVSNDTAICDGSSVTLHATGGAQYDWSPATGLSCTHCASPVATPTAPTTYTVKVTNASGCVAFDSVHVSLLHVTAALAMSDTAACMPATVQFTDQSTADGGVTAWHWAFGDGDTSNLQNPQHVFTHFGQFNVTLTATSANGCTDVASRPIHIRILPSVFAGNDTVICRFDSVGLQVSGGTSFHWSPAAGLDDPNSATPHASPDSTTIYNVVAVDGYGCHNSDTVRVRVNQLPTATVATVPSLCHADSVRLHAAGGVSYSWSPSTGLSDSTIAEPMASPSSNINYHVVVTDSNGCHNSAVVDINVLPLPVTTLTHDTAICATERIMLRATGAQHYQWTPATGLTCDTCANTIAMPSATTRYHVTYTGTNGCIAKDSVLVTVNPLPVTTISPNTAICEGSSTNLVVGGGQTYYWFNNNGLSCDTCAAVTASPIADQMYTVQVTTAAGCRAMDTVRVKVHHINAAFSGDTLSCSPAIENFTNHTTADTTISSYAWTFGDGQADTVTNPQHIYGGGGHYSINLIATSAFGCMDTARMAVTVLQSPTADAGPDRTICLGETVHLEGDGNGAFNWSNANTLDDNTLQNPTSSTTASTTYQLTVTAANGCSLVDSMHVTVNPVPTAHATGAIATCEGDTLHLHATGNGTITWAPAAGLDNAHSASPLFMADSSRVYTLTVANSYGCTASDTIAVKVNPKPSASIFSDGGVCKGNSLSLLGSGNGDMLWTPSAGLSCDNCPNPVATPDTTTRYVLTITNSYQCSATDTQLVEVYALPTVHTVADATVCKGQSYNLHSTASDAGVYQWSPVDGLDNPTSLNPNATPQATTQYVITAQNRYGCVAQDSVTVNVVDHTPLSVSADTAVCAGNPVQLHAYTSAVGNNSAYVTWLPTDSFKTNHSVVQNIIPNRSATYTVIAYAGTCAPDTATIHVTVNPLPTVDLGYNRVVVPQEEVKLAATTTGAISSYEWSPSDNLDCYNCDHVSFIATGPAEYTVTVMDTNGCTATDKVSIKMVTSCEEDIFVPNTFTPNNDGMNDVLYVRGKNLTSIKFFRIFDRWGNLVFETSDINQGWNGLYRGAMVNPGVFVYMVQGTCRNGGDVLKKGNVTLLR